MMKKHLPLILFLLAAAPALAADPEPANPRPTRSSSAGVMRYDANKDGYVDRAEWQAGQEARFRQLDTDKDGKLSKEEMFAGSRGDDRQAERQDRFFRLVDRDGDGFVSKAEFTAQADRNFARCDADKDGRINAEECRQALRRPAVDRARDQR